MYAFPKVDIPAPMIAEASWQGLKPDTFYCKRILETSGICLVPGNGFG